MVALGFTVCEAGRVSSWKKLHLKFRALDILYVYIYMFTCYIHLFAWVGEGCKGTFIVEPSKAPGLYNPLAWDLNPRSFSPGSNHRES